MSNFGGGIGGGSTMKGSGGGTSMPHVVVFEIIFFWIYVLASNLMFLLDLDFGIL